MYVVTGSAIFLSKNSIYRIKNKSEVSLKQVVNRHYVQTYLSNLEHNNCDMQRVIFVKLVSVSHGEMMGYLVIEQFSLSQILKLIPVLMH